MVRDAFSQISTANAEASQPADAKAITEIITLQLPEGFTTLDRMVREKLSALILETLAEESGMGYVVEDASDILALQNTIKDQQAEIEELRCMVARGMK